jgi:hypothetical protein
MSIFQNYHKYSCNNTLWKNLSIFQNYCIYSCKNTFWKSMSIFQNYQIYSSCKNTLWKSMSIFQLYPVYSCKNTLSLKHFQEYMFLVQFTWNKKTLIVEYFTVSSSNFKIILLLKFTQLYIWHHSLLHIYSKL